MCFSCLCHALASEKLAHVCTVCGVHDACVDVQEDKLREWILTKKLELCKITAIALKGTKKNERKKLTNGKKKLSKRQKKIKRRGQDSNLREQSS